MEFQILQIGILIWWVFNGRILKKVSDQNTQNMKQNQNSASYGGPRNWNQKLEFPI